MKSQSTLDGLPKQFVTAMRTLFDIMDDKHTGYVQFADIENRWQDDGAKGLPRGVLESLRKVTPPNGLLSFERFCAGLKISLLRNQVDRNMQQQQQQQQVQTGRTIDIPQARPPSAPLLDLDAPPKPTWTTNTAAIRPNNVMSCQQRTLSMPQLLVDRDESSIPEQMDAMQAQAFEAVKPVPSKPTLYGPPKPPRTGLGILPSAMPPPATSIDRAEIRTALQNWQMGLMMNEEGKEKRAGKYTPAAYNPVPAGMFRTSRSLGDGKPASQTDAQVTGIYQKKANVRRREPRRHTLQNGIDYNMLKRMKQIEQEKDVLMQGLNAIEKARDWYLKQVAAVQEKMKYLGRMGHVEPWSEAQQEKLELQRARVLEVNRYLAALTDSWERGGLPLHMNLAVHHYPQLHDLSSRLKQQNHLLTEDVGKKSERIAVLEREKASLIRELLQIRSQNRNSQEEAVF